MSLVEQSKLSKEVMAFPGLVSLEKDPGDNGQVVCGSAVVVREEAELPNTDFQTTFPCLQVLFTPSFLPFLWLQVFSPSRQVSALLYYRPS